MLRKSAPSIGTATGASWKGQSNKCLPNHRGIICDLEHESNELSTVTRLTPDFEVEIGAGKIEIKAPESTRNLMELRES